MGNVCYPGSEKKIKDDVPKETRNILDFNIKSKEGKKLRIFFFRETEDKSFEILLFKSKNDLHPFKEFRDYEIELDPSAMHGVARVFLEQGLGIKFQVSPHKDLTWNLPEFFNWLGKINETVEYFEDATNKAYFIREPKILEENNLIINNIFEWFRIEDALQWSSVCPELQKFIKNIGGLEFFLNMDNEAKPTYAVIDAEPVEVFVNYYGALYQSQLRKPGERWKVYKVFEGHFPTEEEFNQIKGYVISGSRNSANDEDDFVVKLSELVKKIIDLPEENRPKILGICFGHQIVARAIGGKIEKMANIDQAGCHYWINKQKINLTEEFKKKNYVEKSKVFEKIKFEDGLLLSECHSEEVTELPEIPNLQIFGNSNVTKYEMYGIDNSVLCFQAHPEFLVNIQQYKILVELLDDETEGEIRKKLLAEYLDGPIHTKDALAIGECFLKNN